MAVYWRSYELRPVGSRPLSPEYRERILNARPRTRAVAREHYGLELHEGPFGINSRPALIGAKFAEANGKGQAYHKSVFQAYWQQALSIDDQQVLTEIARTVGLDTESFQAALDDKTLEEAVLADEEQAYLQGFTGVPALVFLRKYLVMGAQPYSALKEIIERIEVGAIE